MLRMPWIEATGCSSRTAISLPPGCLLWSDSSSRLMGTIWWPIGVMFTVHCTIAPLHNQAASQTCHFTNQRLHKPATSQTNRSLPKSFISKLLHFKIPSLPNPLTSKLSHFTIPSLSTPFTQYFYSIYG